LPRENVFQSDAEPLALNFAIEVNVEHPADDDDIRLRRRWIKGLRGDPARVRRICRDEKADEQGRKLPHISIQSTNEAFKQHYTTLTTA
jgi:hypothetical protein